MGRKWHQPNVLIYRNKADNDDKSFVGAYKLKQALSWTQTQRFDGICKTSFFVWHTLLSYAETKLDNISLQLTFEHYVQTNTTFITVTFFKKGIQKGCV